MIVIHSHGVQKDLVHSEAMSPEPGTLPNIRCRFNNDVLRYIKMNLESEGNNPIETGPRELLGEAFLDCPGIWG